MAGGLPAAVNVLSLHAGRLPSDLQVRGDDFITQNGFQGRRGLQGRERLEAETMIPSTASRCRNR
jgi:hypothetical protein